MLDRLCAGLAWNARRKGDAEAAGILRARGTHCCGTSEGSHAGDSEKRTDYQLDQLGISAGPNCVTRGLRFRPAIRDAQNISSALARPYAIKTIRWAPAFHRSWLVRSRIGQYSPPAVRLMAFMPWP